MEAPFGTTPTPEVWACHYFPKWHHQVSISVSLVIAFLLWWVKISIIIGLKIFSIKSVSQATNLGLYLKKINIQCCSYFYPLRFLLEIRVIIKTSKKILVSHKLWLIWIRMKQKFFFEKKIQNGRLKKTEFFNYPQKLSNCRQNFTDWTLG